MSIYLTGRLSQQEQLVWLDALRQALPDEHIDTRVVPGQADSVELAVVANPRPGSLQGLRGLRLIQSLWAGVDRLLLDDSLPADVPLARMVDPWMSRAMAETVLWAVVSLQRDFFTYARQQQQACWSPRPQRRAEDWRVGLLGWGQMGTTAAAALLAQGYRVSAWRAGASAATGVPAGVSLHEGPAALPSLLAGTDVLVNLLPLTPSTRGLLDARLLAQLPSGASLVNLARGAHLVDSDLLAALDRGHLAHAVLDVFHAEPLAADHPFWRHPGVTVLPHAAAQTDPRSAAGVVADNLHRLRTGRPLQHLVDRQRGY